MAHQVVRTLWAKPTHIAKGKAKARRLSVLKIDVAAAYVS